MISAEIGMQWSASSESRSAMRVMVRRISGEMSWGTTVYQQKGSQNAKARTNLVLAAVHALAALLAKADLLAVGLERFRNRLRDPDVAVETDDEVYAEGEGVEVGL